MTKKIRALLVAAFALVAVSAFASAASANTINASPAGNITMTSLGKLTFSGGLSIRCNVTLTGSLARSASNTTGTPIGSITGSTVRECEGAGEASALVEPEEPWTIALGAAWAGPGNNVSLTLKNSAFVINNIPFVGNCLYKGDANGTLPTTATGVTGLLTSSANSVPKFEGPGGCPSSGRLVGTFRVTTQTLSLT